MHKNSFLGIVAELMSEPDFYWQIISIVFCLILSFVFYKTTRRHVLPKIIARTLKNKADLNRAITRYIMPMLFPLFAVVILSIGISIYAQFFHEVTLFSTTLKLITLFLFLRFLRISSNSSFVTNAAGLFLMPALILDVLGLLESTITYLDQYALKIGSFRISVYLGIKAFIVLLIAFWFSSLVSRKSKDYIDSRKSMKSSTKTIMTKVIDISVYTIIVIVLLKTFGVDFTTLAVIGGAIGVGIGFGLQKIASNFISGIILLFEKTVEIGDVVELENGSIFGTVKHFGGRYTLIEEIDGREIMVPNEELIINKVTNWTYSNNRARVRIDFGVSHDSDLRLVKELAMAAAKEHPRCLDYPEIECYARDFGEYDIKFTLYFWISDITEGRQLPRSEVIINICDKFRENGVKIPYPQREVVVRGG